MTMNGEEKRKLRETTFADQIEAMFVVEWELEGRWVIQKFAYEEWRGLWVNPIATENPVSEMWSPFNGVPSYATSGEATDAMMELQTIAPDRRMRVVRAEKDIGATLLTPRTAQEQATFGRGPRWGELLRKFPKLRMPPRQNGESLKDFPVASVLPIC
jgi:hypothetical protein